MLGVSTSGYYWWLNRAPVPTNELALPAWQVAAQRVFFPHAGRDGQRRLRAQLRRGGYQVGPPAFARLAQHQCSVLRALCTRVSSRTTQADP